MNITPYNKWLRRRASLFFIFMLILSTLIFMQFTLVQPVSASPGSLFYDSNPTSHASSAWTITDPTYAYDGNWGTHAVIPYESVRTSAGSAYFEVTPFNTTGAPTDAPTRVDVKIRYEADAAAGSGGYDIEFNLGASSDTLLSSRPGAAHSIPAAGYDVWEDRPRPGGGTWAWADFATLAIRVCNTARDAPQAAPEFRMYEAWLSVICGANTTFVFPASIVNTTLTPETPITLRPDADGSYAGMGWDGDYTDWDEADPHDGNTTYLNASSPWSYETSTLDDTPGQSWRIAKVKVTIWALNSSATDDRVIPILLVGGNEYWGPMKGFTGETSDGSYMKFTAEWALNPDTDTYWTWSDINSTEAGVVAVFGDDASWDAGLEVRVTQLYVEVTGPLLEVDVWCNYVDNLWAFQFDMRFNPAVILGVWYSEGDSKPTKVGPFLGSDGGTPLVGGTVGFNNTLGRLFITGYYLSQTTDAYCPDGLGHLATVFFEVVGKGESDLRLGPSTGLMRPPPPSGDWIAQGRKHVEDGYFRNANPASMPKARFTVTPVGTPVPLEGYNTTFDATSSTPNGGSITTYKWYFWEVYHGSLIGDTIITTSITTLNFTERGTYNITLIVIDDGGYVGINETYITIKAHDLFFSSVIMINATNEALPPALVPTIEIDKTLQVNVTVINEGDFTETNVNVTLFWDVDIAGTITYGQIGTQYGINLAKGASYNTTFYWDTTGCNVTHPRQFGLHANASAVPYEYDKELDETKVADNEYVATGPRVRLHDITITQMTTNATSVVQGKRVRISATVVNQGDYNETNIIVTAYFDDTSISAETIPITTNSSFATWAGGEWANNHTTTLIFDWDTTTPGVYTIKANTSAVANDYDTGDNTFIFGTVTVTSGVPEFPFGIALEIALLVVIIYIGWRSRRKNKPPQLSLKY